MPVEPPRVLQPALGGVPLDGASAIAVAASTSRLAISPAYFATARPANRVWTAGGNATLTSTPTAAPRSVSTIREVPVDWALDA